MGHLLANPDLAYQRLQQRLDRMPTGAPDSAVFQQILRLLFTEEEAGIAADRAARNGEQVRLEPMSASERRMVHEVLKERSDVETFSEGDDPERRVVIAPLVSD